MKNKFKNVKPGQKVWSLIFGKGKVVQIDDNSKPGSQRNDYLFVMLVEFNNRISHQYDMFGVKIEYGSVKPDLYLKKPVITTKKRINELRAESYGEGMVYGKMFSVQFPDITAIVKRSNENMLPDIVEKTIRIVSANLFQTEGSDFNIYQLKEAIVSLLKENLNKKPVINASKCSDQIINATDCTINFRTNMQKLTEDEVHYLTDLCENESKGEMAENNRKDFIEQLMGKIQVNDLQVDQIYNILIVLKTCPIKKQSSAELFSFLRQPIK